MREPDDNLPPFFDAPGELLTITEKEREYATFDYLALMVPFLVGPPAENSALIMVERELNVYIAGVRTSPTTKT